MIPEKYRVPLLALATAIIAAVVYIPSINAPFVYDDRHAIYQNPAVLGGASLKDIFTDPSTFSSSPNMRMYRPLTLLSYCVTYRVAGFHMSAWHGFHILFHAINAALLFLIMLKIFTDKRVAALATLLWAVHPLASEGVIYQAARSNLLSATSVLAALYLYMSGSNSSLRRGFSAAIFALGLLCKETAIMLPAIMLWYDVNCKSGRPAATIRINYWINYIPFAVIVCAYVIMRMVFLKLETFHVVAPVRPVGENLLTQTSALMLYLREAFWPVKLSIEHDLPTLKSFTPSDALLWRWPLLALPLFFLMAASAVAFRKKAFTWSLGIVWWFVALAPESSIIPLVQVANERRAYLPLAGLALAAGAGIDRLLNRKGAASNASTVSLIALILLGFFVLTINREKEWKTQDALWTAAIKAYPNSTVAMHGLATTKLDDEGDLRGAEWLYRRIIRLDPTYFGARMGMGRLLMKKGDMQGAAEQFLEAVKLGPDEDEPWVALSELYNRSGGFDHAEQAARRAIELNPRSVRGWNNLGSALGGQGKMQEALAMFERSISLNPAYAIGHLNRGLALQKLGRADEARIEYQKAINMDPSLTQARKALKSMNR